MTREEALAFIKSYKPEPVRGSCYLPELITEWMIDMVIAAERQGFCEGFLEGRQEDL